MDIQQQHERNINNPYNKLLTRKDIIKILKKNGMDYKEYQKKIDEIPLETFQAAFNHKSFCM